MTQASDEIVLDTETVDIETVLQEILTPMFKNLTQELRTYIKSEVEQTLRTSARHTDENDEEEEGDVSPEVKALQKKLALMEQRAKEQEAQQEADKLRTALTEIVQSHKSDSPKLAQVALREHLGELVKASDGTYMTKDGKSITEAAKEFFATSDGMRLLPADMRQGSGLPNGKPPRSQGTGEVSTDEAILRTFGAGVAL